MLDDAAVICPSPAGELVVKTDAIVAEVDFMPDARAERIARKALRVNLSDLAAKAEPSIAEGPQVVVLDDHERPLALTAEGWVHFGMTHAGCPSRGTAKWPP